MSNILQSLMGHGQPKLTVLALNGKQSPPRPPHPEGAANDAEPPSLRSAKRVDEQAGNQLMVVPLRLSDSRSRVRSVALDRVSPLLASNDGLAFASEQYRILRTRITQLLPNPFTLAVTSPSVGDGKTTTAINLAAALALRSEERTLLIDADLRRSGVHRMLQIPNEPGLADVLEGACRLEDAVFEVAELTGFQILPAGTPHGNPTELLDSGRWRDLAGMFRQRFARTVIDCPPVEVVADSDLISTVCNGTILVLRPDHTDRTLGLNAIENLKPKLTGVVINAAPDWFLRKRPAYRNYYHYRQDTQSGKSNGLE